MSTGPKVKSQDRFNEALEHVLQVEGGFVNHPADKGGATKFGITRATLAAWRTRPVSVEDVQRMNREEAAAIYRKRYWDYMRLDAIEDASKCLVLFDQAVNRGCHSVVMQAQSVANRLGAIPSLVADGKIGPKTIAVLNALDDRDFCREFLQASELFYAELCIRNPGQLVFLKGWLNRVHALQDVLWTGSTQHQGLGCPKAQSR